MTDTQPHIAASEVPSHQEAAAASAVLGRYLADLKLRAVAAGVCAGSTNLYLMLFADGCGEIAGGGQRFGDPMRPIGEAFAATETAIAGPPFAPGDLVIFRRCPQEGHLKVTACERYDDGEDWRLDYRDGHVSGSAPAREFVAIPFGWRDPPPRPMPACEVLERQHDGPIPAAELILARAEDEAEGGAAFAAWCGEMARWWNTHGKRINHELAEKQAAGFAEMAKRAAPPEAA